MSKAIAQYTTFDQNYIDKCKVFWYSSGRLDATKFKKVLEDHKFADDKSHIPSIPLLRTWIANYGWNEWADIMDARAAEIVEADVVQQKAEMLRIQAEHGRQLQELGMKSLRSDGFDSASAAVQAVIKGAELERTSRGIGETLVRLSKMTDDQLKQEIIAELERASQNNQIIEADELPSNESKDD